MPQSNNFGGGNSTFGGVVGRNMSNMNNNNTFGGVGGPGNLSKPMG